jgi:ribonuclease VapC
VIFVDTSAIIAIIAKEPNAAVFADKIEAEDERITSAHVLLEASMRLASILSLSPTVADALVMRLLGEAAIAFVPITEAIGHDSVAAFERYGKGRKNRAGLNFGDCLSYACAKAHGARLLFKGGDFAHTDIARA